LRRRRRLLRCRRRLLGLLLRRRRTRWCRGPRRRTRWHGLLLRGRRSRTRLDLRQRCGTGLRGLRRWRRSRTRRRCLRRRRRGGPRRCCLGGRRRSRPWWGCLRRRRRRRLCLWRRWRGRARRCRGRRCRRAWRLARRPRLRILLCLFRSLRRLSGRRRRLRQDDGVAGSRGWRQCRAGGQNGAREKNRSKCHCADISLSMKVAADPPGSRASPGPMAGSCPGVAEFVAGANVPRNITPTGRNRSHRHGISTVTLRFSPRFGFSPVRRARANS
jgi:hypothetical protein